MSTTHFSFYIGLRYLRAKRDNHFISFISIVSILGLGLGVAVLIVVLSVMNGFDREMRTRVLGMIPHVTLEQPGGLAQWRQLAQQVRQQPAVLGVSPFIDIQGMLSAQGRNKAVWAVGIDPDSIGQVSIVPQFIHSGALAALQPGQFSIVLGDILARNLGVTLGDSVLLLVPDLTVSIGGVSPRFKRFVVAGTFSVRAEVDASMALIHLDDARALMRLGEGRVDGLRLQVDDLFQARAIGQSVAQSLPGYYYLRDWTMSHGNLYQAIQLEKRTMGLLLAVIVAVAAFNIVSALVMLVQDKKADIAILRTLGARPGQIMLAFMVQGFAIGCIGSVGGIVLGIVVALTLSDIVSGLESLLGIQVLDGSVYFIDYFPSHLQLNDVGLISLFALLTSLLATLYPAYRASKVMPAEALRYE